jgi:CspA family cold shock protein
MSEGIVKWFNYQKGYGFIESSEFKENIFLHHTSFIKEEYIHEGCTVNFTLIPGEKGFKAKDVSLKG